MLNWIETLEYNIKDAENLVGAFSKENIREKVSLFQLGRVSFQSVVVVCPFQANQQPHRPDARSPSCSEKNPVVVQFIK